MAISKLTAAKKAGSAPMGTKWKIKRGESSQDFRVPMPAGAREIGAEEEGRLIASGWRAGAMTSSVAKKVSGAPPVSSAGSAKGGPKPSASPARNTRAKATTVASSAPAGHSTTRLHTPSTSVVPPSGASPAAPTSRLTLPKDSTGGDAGATRNIVGLGVAGLAAVVARKPLIGAAKLAGKAVKGVAWTLPRAVAGKVTPKTAVQKRVAALTAKPSPGAGTGRPSAPVPKFAGKATGATVPAATTKPQRGAAIPTPKPAATGSAAVTVTPHAAQANASSTPQKGAPVPGREQVIADVVQKVRAEKIASAAATTAAEKAKEGRVQEVIKQETAKRASRGAPVPGSTTPPATSAPTPRMPLQGARFSNETLDEAFRRAGFAPRPPKKGAPVPAATPKTPMEAGRELEKLGPRYRLDPEAARRGVPVHQFEIDEALEQATGKPAKRGGRTPSTTGPSSPGLLESAGLKPATPSAVPGEVKTPSGQTVVLRKGKGGGRRKPAPAKGQPVNTQHGVRQEAQRAVADEAAAVTKAAVQGDVAATKNPPPPKPKTEADIAREFGKASEYQGMREHVVRRQIDALAGAAAKVRADKVTAQPKPTTPANPVPPEANVFAGARVAQTAGQRATIGEIIPPAVREKLEASRIVQARQGATPSVTGGVPEGQTEFETPKEVAKRTKKAERKARLQQTTVGSAARVDVGAEARAARKSAIEEHMAKKGFTRVATATPEDIVEKRRPAITKEMPFTPTQDEAGGGARAVQVKAEKAAKKGKPGRFTIAAQPEAAVKRARVRGGKAPRGTAIPKLGLLGGVATAAAMAESAQAAPAGQKAAAAVRTGGKDLLTMAAMGAAAAAVPAAAPVIAGYAAYQTARALPQIGRDVFTAAREGLKAGSAFYDAYKNRKASEAKWGSVSKARATQKKKGIL